MANKILVFDIGKTNKKLLLFSEDLKLLQAQKASFDEVVRGNENWERLAATEEWLKTSLAQIAKEHELGALCVSTHGATIVCIDENGQPAVPPVAYTTEPGAAFQTEFYKKFGDAVELQRQTATPRFGNLLSPAKTIYYLQQHYAADFARVRQILNFPQYFAYLLSGKVCAEPTYIGCHSYLWDFQASRWSDVAIALGIENKLPSLIKPSWYNLGPCRAELLPGIPAHKLPLVTAGIHDSNASLLPYLIKAKEDFVLNSTGTWCVAMRPAQQVLFAEEELGKSVFYNLSPFNEPVKTAIFMGGLEFDTYLQLLQKIHGNRKLPVFNKRRIGEILRKANLFILPSVVKGTGQFPEAPPRVVEEEKIYPLADLQAGKAVPAFFKNFETAYAVLNISLAIQTKVTLDRVGASTCSRIYIEGGFRRNEQYNKILSALYPQKRIMLTGMEEATAFGAALLGKAALEGKTPRELADCFELDFKPITTVRLKDLESYTGKYLASI